MIARPIIPTRKLVAAAAGAAICATGAGPARAEDVLSSLAAQPSPIDTPDGPKDQLRRVGITPDVWVTQIYQGEPGGDGSKTWTYGGKFDGFLKIDAEKLGLWSGLHVNVQYEHYFGENINRKDFALIPVNTAQAYLGEGTFHSALSISVTQDLSEQVSVSAGKFNMMTLASRTPLIGGGGIDTFMNRALALPSTGVAYTAARGGAADRVVISAPYLIGGLMTIKTAPVIVTVRPARSAQRGESEKSSSVRLKRASRRAFRRPFQRRFSVLTASTRCAPPIATRAALISTKSARYGRRLEPVGRHQERLLVRLLRDPAKPVSKRDESGGRLGAVRARGAVRCKPDARGMEHACRPRRQ